MWNADPAIFIGISAVAGICADFAGNSEVAYKFLWNFVEWRDLSPATNCLLLVLIWIAISVWVQEFYHCSMGGGAGIWTVGSAAIKSNQNHIYYILAAMRLD